MIKFMPSNVLGYFLLALLFMFTDTELTELYAR